MIRALIIDDEPVVREGLLKRVHWGMVGIDQVEAVESAEEAMLCIREKKPDIVLSDIRLPGMNGMELCEWIRDEGIDCRIILISGYCDREYLKGAIRISAEDYIDKPIDLQEVEECLQKTVRKCHKVNDMQDMLEEYREELADVCVKRLLRGETSDSLWQKLPDSWCKLPDDAQYLCVILQLGRAQSGSPALLAQLQEKTEAELGSLRKLFYKKDDSCLVMLTGFTKGEYLQEAYRLLEAWKERIRAGQFAACKLIAAMSDRVTGKGQIAESYRQTASLLQKGFYIGYDQMITAEVIRSGEDHTAISLHEFERLLKAREEEGLIGEVKRLYACAACKYGVPPSTMKSMYIDMNQKILAAAESAPATADADWEMEKGVIWSKIQNYDTLLECHEYTLWHITRFFRNREGLLSDNKMVVYVLQYIRQHYRDQELSVNRIAEVMNLSVAYLSTFFKKQTGVTIGQQIRNTRMSRSVQMLSDPVLGMEEIARACGYDNANYWSKVFRKVYKMSPSEYREKIL